MATVKITASALALFAFSVSVATAGEVAADPDQQPAYVLSLQYEGATPSSPDDYRKLYELALKIAESSQFNSRKPLWTWDLAETLAQYRRAVDGRYLLISYASPRILKTMGGDITVKEIIIGLNNSQYASSLHTVDDEGRIVGHAKYSGDLCLKLYQLVTSMSVDRHLTMRWSGP
jgi:hypothetical protein